ncbi:MAG: YcaO-like family protein [Candidatus Omnitrophota bacterium]
MDKYRFYTDQDKAQLKLRYQLNNLLKQAISRRSGIIKTVFEHYREPDIAGLYNFSTVLCQGTQYGDGYYDPPQNNGGAAYTRLRSYVGAIGESLERYCSSFQDPTHFIFDSYNTLVKRGYNLFDPEQITLFSDTQYEREGFPFKKFTRNTRVCWAEAEKLNPNGTSKPIYYPAWLIYMPYGRHPEEPVLGYGISTGMAAGPIGSARPTLSGLQETLERDAYMIVWHNQLPVPKLDWRKSPRISKMIREKFPDAEYADITINVLTTDIEIPVMIATKIEKNNPNSCLTLGVSADTDVETCAIEAIKEMVQDYYYIRYLVRTKEKVAMTKDFSNIDDFEKRVILWGYPEMLPYYDFLAKNPKEELSVEALKKRYPNFAKTFNSDEERIWHLVKCCTDLGYDVIRKDITTPDVYALGVQVCKTFVPQCQPLEGDHNYRFYGGKRMVEVPVKMGYRTTLSKESDLNPVPHPLP